MPGRQRDGEVISQGLAELLKWVRARPDWHKGTLGEAVPAPSLWPWHRIRADTTNAALAPGLLSP